MSSSGPCSKSQLFLFSVLILTLIPLANVLQPQLLARAVRSLQSPAGLRDQDTQSNQVDSETVKVGLAEKSDAAALPSAQLGQQSAQLGQQSVTVDLVAERGTLTSTPKPAEVATAIQGTDRPGPTYWADQIVRQLLNPTTPYDKARSEDAYTAVMAVSNMKAKYEEILSSTEYLASWSARAQPASTLNTQRHLGKLEGLVLSTIRQSVNQSNVRSCCMFHVCSQYAATSAGIGPACSVYLQHIPKTGTGFKFTVLQHFCPQSFGALHGQNSSELDVVDRIHLLREATKITNTEAACPWLRLLPSSKDANEHAATPASVFAPLDDECCGRHQPLMFTMLRDPVQRLWSAFSFGYRANDAPFGVEFYRREFGNCRATHNCNISLEEYLNFAVSGVRVFSNCMTKMMLGFKCYQRVNLTNSHLNIAIQTLAQKNVWFGITDRWNASMQLWEHEVGQISEITNAMINSNPTSATKVYQKSRPWGQTYFDRMYDAKPTDQQQQMIKDSENFDVILYRQALLIFESRQFKSKVN